MTAEQAQEQPAAHASVTEAAHANDAARATDTSTRGPGGDDWHDVFNILYSGEDWDDDDDDDDEDANVEPGVSDDTVLVCRGGGEDDDGVGVTYSSRARYHHAFFADALDSLVGMGQSSVESTPTLPPLSSKKRRIYHQASRPPSFITSTTALPALPSPSEVYAPYSLLPLLSRLRTFAPTLYSTRLPESLGPRPLALAGWHCRRQDTLGCGSCASEWSVQGLDRIPDARVRTRVVDRVASELSVRHAKGCAWRIRSSPPSLLDQLGSYFNPLVADSLEPLARSIQIRTLAGPLDPAITYPLTTAALDTLLKSLERRTRAVNDRPKIEHKVRPADKAHRKEAHRPLDSSVAVPVSPLAAALALFGWYPYDPTYPTDHVEESGSGLGSDSSKTHATPTDIVRCRVCERRVGLWSFSTKTGPSSVTRTFDLRKDHFAWCPLAVDGWWCDSPIVGGTAASDKSVSASAPAPGPDSASFTWDSESGARVKALLTVSERPFKRWRRA